jgi:hypothetical protein
MEEKGEAAWKALHAHFSATLTRTDKAVFRREIVRRYNGSSEFKWDATKSEFVIDPGVPRWENKADPSQGASNRLPYPNRVLGTSIVYSTGRGANTTFPWPIAFPASEYGPDI